MRRMLKEVQNKYKKSSSQARIFTKLSLIDVRVNFGKGLISITRQGVGQVEPLHLVSRTTCQKKKRVKGGKDEAVYFSFLGL